MVLNGHTLVRIRHKNFSLVGFYKKIIPLSDMQKKDPNAVTEADRFTTKTSFSESQSRQSKIPKKLSKKSR